MGFADFAAKSYTTRNASVFEGIRKDNFEGQLVLHAKTLRSRNLETLKAELLLESCEERGGGGGERW